MLRVASTFFLYLLIGATLGLSGCMNYFAPFETEPARIGAETRVHDRFAELPEPRDQVVAAVYRFRDQTGQYKPSQNIASWSTAVTQGSTSILMRALETSGWFDVIEREGLSNLMNERQIISSMRQMHEGDRGAGPLPPLRFAGILLEGGIIGYDSNILTGGAGARYFGAGGSGEFRQDQVTIYLRAVSTQSGRVLKTVHTTKTILSQKVDVGLFRFIEPERILETEVGYTFNEPPVQAVTEAIEEAVFNLIIEGAREGLWTPADEDALQSAIFKQQERERARAANLDAFHRMRDSNNRRGIGFGTTASATRYQGDFQDPLVRGGADLHLRGTLTPRWGLGLSAGAGELAADRAFSRSHVAAEVQTLYYALPHSRVTPYATVGGGLLMQRGHGSFEVGRNAFPYAMAGGGLEWMATPSLALHAGLHGNLALVDGIDGRDMGSFNDGFWNVRAGITYYTRLF